MERIFIEYLKLLSDINFRKFQNYLSQKIYNTLVEGYTKGYGEIKLVKNLVKAINNSKFHKFKFYGHKIHGPISYVDFKYRNEPTTKELADMVIISIASHRKKRILQKITFIQNKLSKDKEWDIDEEQLFLLKNFPILLGNKGILKSFSDKDVIFFNYSSCLGSFGLFMEPGDMIFLSAPLLLELKKGGKIKIEEIKLTESIPYIRFSSCFFPFSTTFYHLFWEEFRYSMPKYIRNNIPIPFIYNSSFPFLNNSIFSRDIYDFIRNFTQFNIGEPTYAFGKIINPDLDKFTNFLLKTIGIQDIVDLPSEGLEGEFNNGIALLVMHIDLGEE